MAHRMLASGLRPKRTKLSDQLYVQLVENVVAGGISEGSKLPSEKKLVETYGVSRPTVREALLRLKNDGLIEVRRGSGAYLLRRPSERLIELIQVADLPEILMCYEARIAIEGSAARLAARRRTAEEVLALKRQLVKLERVLSGRHSSIDADMEFHRQVAMASHNTFLVEMFRQLEPITLKAMRLALGLTKRGSDQRAYKVWGEHEAIVEAIEARDGQAAEVAMQSHIYRVQRRVLDRTKDQ